MNLCLRFPVLLLFTAILCLSRVARAEQTTTHSTITAVAFSVLPSVAKQTPADFGDKAAQIVLQHMRRSVTYRAFDFDGNHSGIRFPLPLFDTWYLDKPEKRLTELGRVLGATNVLTGAVTAVRVGGNPRRARVTIFVLIVDVAAGGIVNEAIASGYSPIPRPGAKLSDELLKEAALSNAAWRAVKIMDTYSLPVATIVRAAGKRRIQVDHGEKDGMVVGQEMVVVRGSTRIGKVRLTNVYASRADAEMLDLRSGVRPGDRAVAVFPIPSY